MVKTKQSKAKPLSIPVQEEQSDRVHHHPAWSPGDVAHQGDIIIIGLAGLPQSATPRKNRQLADGATRGAKHVLVLGDCYDADPSEVAGAIRVATNGRVIVDLAYIGPVIARECLIEHPEHQHQSFPDHLGSAVVYQRNLDSEGRARRALD